jgi:hypothetical protein
MGAKIDLSYVPVQPQSPATRFTSDGAPTIRATGLPWRVIVISAPASASVTNAEM